MGTTTNYIIIIFVMTMATQISRLSPIVLSKVKLSSGVHAWLGHMPIAILTALVIPEIFIPGSEDQLVLNKFFFVAVLVSLFVGMKYKNLLLSTFAGVVTVILMRLCA